MRDYGKVSPLFWVGKTGKALRKHPEAQIVALYLMTCPTSEMTGVFHCPLMYIAHETGLGEEGASKGLQRLVELDFCTFEEDSDTVFVHEMAKYQIGDSLKVNDKQVIGVKRAYANMPQGLIRRGFYERYKEAFHLDPEPAKIASTEGPSKTLRSQEQEQEQKQEQGARTEQVAPAGAIADKNASSTKDEAPNPLNLETWQAYKSAYTTRYTVPPIRDAATNTKIKVIVKALGAEAPAVAAFFVSHNGSRYVAGMHQVGFLATDYAKLRTEWATRRQMTAAQASQADKTQTNLNAFQPLIDAARAEEARNRGGDDVEG